MRTSVITTVVLLYDLWHPAVRNVSGRTVWQAVLPTFAASLSRATSNDECRAAKLASNAQGFIMVTTKGEKASAAGAHRLTRRPGARQPSLDTGQSRAERESNRLQPVEQATADFLYSSLPHSPEHAVARLRLIRNCDATVHLSRG
jgi:hypothetical protein